MIKYVIVTTYEWAIELNDASRAYSSLADAKQELRRLYDKTIKELEDDEINDETFSVRGYYDEYEGKWAFMRKTKIKEKIWNLLTKFTILIVLKV